MTELAAKLKNEPMEQFARRAGRAAASDALTGVYRLFALVTTPTALLSRASNMWSTIYSCGTLRIENEQASHARVRVVDFPTGPAACARLSGWMERMAEMTGSKNPRVVHDRCVSKGAAACEWDLHW